jgi:tRNA(fMet)-specific endonuclease VapC
MRIVEAAKRARPDPRFTQGPGLWPFKGLVVIEVTFDVAYMFGSIRASLLDQGLSIPGMDLLIASTALVNKLTLVTHNTKDFAHVPGLSAVDWLQP